MDNVRILQREDKTRRRKIKAAIQVHNKTRRRKIKAAIQGHKNDPTLNRDLGIEIPAVTLKLLSCDPWVTQ